MTSDADAWVALAENDTGLDPGGAVCQELLRYSGAGHALERAS